MASKKTIQGTARTPRVLDKTFVFLLLTICTSAAQNIPIRDASQRDVLHFIERLPNTSPTLVDDAAFLFQLNATSPPIATGQAAAKFACDQLPSQQSTQTASCGGVNPSLSSATLSESESAGKQPKRILWIIPNYRAVSADTQRPPLSFKGKFWLATQDSFDYSSFLLSGILAGVGQGKNATPEFRQGAVGFGRYYWHSFADQALGNYLTEAFVPAAFMQDPRYYTLGHGGLFRRTGYAITRLLVTRTDGGGLDFNFSEIVGNGAGAGISDVYYPAPERTWTKTGQKWLTQVAIDGVFNIFKEFWPDINRTVFGGHY